MIKEENERLKYELQRAAGDRSRAPSEGNGRGRPPGSFGGAGPVGASRPGGDPPPIIGGSHHATPQSSPFGSSVAAFQRAPSTGIFGSSTGVPVRPNHTGPPPPGSISSVHSTTGYSGGGHHADPFAPPAAEPYHR